LRSPADAIRLALATAREPRLSKRSLDFGAHLGLPRQEEGRMQIIDR
jgi:hypothetical protein